MKISVRGFLEQTVKDSELLILDDGRKPSPVPPEMMNSRIKYVRGNAKEGFYRPIGEKLNRLCEMTQGEFIIRMDSDDFSCPERIEKQVKYLRGGSQLIGISRTFYYDFVRKQAVHERRTGVGLGASHAFRRNCWEKHRFDDKLRINEDVVFWNNIGSGWLIDDPNLIVIGRHQTNTSHRNKPLPPGNGLDDLWELISLDRLPSEFLKAIQ
jgi:glycosyltransferase involved in cell wall biosynthesis